ncbi:murein L,D-transpeptidase family protein [Herminiimonas sp. KBW02]|uniref:L,D-transpeptidase family protein n=1 Tax=Herminiimonas sp. KBW02 TaxID=2153363 RepID=UPI001F027317|nr:L,D-transpeptidase family protein [Herminiimonas sp. KBW02]
MATPAWANGSKPGVPARLDPEIMLIDVYKALAANRLRDAQAKADALVAAYPTFRLGHLVRGDLLLLHTRPIKTFGAAPNAPADKLNNLRDEAIVRLKSLRERPDPEMIPRAILQMRDDQKNVLLVDAKRSRLYVYQRVNGQFKLTSDYYISQGRLGVNKFKEGDQKTPLGVYYITARLPGARLPEFYGPGALPINYPNEWDKANGRSGSGIWLHGTPSDSYSRPPLSSDGCVVLTNPDLKELSASVEIGNTPVIISEDLKFVSKAKWDADRQAANKMLESWRADLETTDPELLRRHYSRNFKAMRGQNLNNWLDKVQQSNLGARKIGVSLRDVTLFRYPDQKDQKELIVAAFTQEATIGKGRHVTRKRQYWAKEGAQWKIVSEVNL